MIPEHKIQEVLDRADLVTVVSRHVELKKAGREFKGRCPFHQEKTPSFYVVPEKRFYFCHGCRASGDAVSFLMRYLGKNFLDAVRDLAREVGVDLEAAEDPAARERQQLKEVTDLAAEHFRALLWADEGRDARAYLASRGVNEDTAQAFGLGWAAEGWTLLADKLTRSGMLEWGLKAGLINRRAKGDGYYDFFRGRLMVPIRAPEGRPIAFGGRRVGGEEGPKYLNSKESALFNKSDTLFGMDQARDDIRRQRLALLVEGYFDCIGLHQAGLRNTVALCSTALTPGHLQALRRAEARDLVLLLDGDAAGLNAVERLAGPLLAAGAATRVALLPQGDDPDTFVRREGPEGVQRLLAASQALTTHLFTAVLPAGSQASFEEKMAALERLKPVTGHIPVGLVRSAFFEALAGHFGWPASQLESSLRAHMPKPAAPAASSSIQAPRPSARPGPGGGAQGSALHQLESWYVAAVVREPRLLARDGLRLYDEISHPGLRLVLAQATTGGQGTEDALFDAPDALKRLLEHRLQLLPDGGLPLEQAFSKICRQLALKRIDERLTYIHRATEQTPGSFDLTEETRQLLVERGELLALKKRVDAETREPPPGTKLPMQPV